MAAYFADNVHLVALLHDRDELHAAALEFDGSLRAEGATFVTTDLVLAECLAAFSRKHPSLRILAARYARAIHERFDFEVAPLTRDLIGRGIDLYEARPDKRYSLTDTVSMIVCRDRGITDVLTADRDFEQEGFRALLKR